MSGEGQDLERKKTEKCLADLLNIWAKQSGQSKMLPCWKKGPSARSEPSLLTVSPKSCATSLAAAILRCVLATVVRHLPTWIRAHCKLRLKNPKVNTEKYTLGVYTRIRLV